MALRTFEVNGLRLSSMTLGTVQLGLPYGVANRVGQPSISESHAILDEALRGGVTCLDTARSYGDAEDIIGSYLSLRTSHIFSRPTIVTKFALGAKLTGKEIERAIIESVETSLKHLQSNALDVAMLHHAGDLLHWGPQIMAACRLLIRNGYAKKTGVSLGAESAEMFWRIWIYVKDPLFEVIQVPVNVLDQRLIQSGAWRELTRANKIVFARSVFLQGLLYLHPERLPAQLQEARPTLERLRRLADREGMSVAQLAVSYVRDLPGVHSLVIGAETPEQVRRNLVLMEGPPIREDTRAEIARQFSDVPEKVVSPHMW